MVIRKISPHKYELRSLRTGKLLGTFKSKEAAKVRERQIEYYKHLSAMDSRNARKTR